MTQGKAILIVEDEPLIVMMLEDFFDALGHRVVDSCDTAAAGLAAVARGGIDAAILDLNLRGDGTSAPVADALAAAGVPFLFASGGSGESIPDRFRDRPTLAKPFSLDAIEAALATL
jgi:DNA-binding response OmpR family regulator